MALRNFIQQHFLAHMKRSNIFKSRIKAFIQYKGQARFMEVLRSTVNAYEMGYMYWEVFSPKWKESTSYKKI